MPSFYIDASALVKRYVQGERGAATVNAILDDVPTNAVYMAAIGETEVIAAISRRGRVGRELPGEAELALTRAAQEAESRWVKVEITAATIHYANLLARNRFLRGYDAVHLAAALTTARTLREGGVPLTFVSADGRLNEAAQAEGLSVLDPTD